MPTPPPTTVTVTVTEQEWCECCEQRPALTRIALPGDEVRLCGTCLDDARALGLIDTLPASTRGGGL